MKHSFVQLLIFASLFAACKKETPPQVDLGENYLPLVVGNWVEYTVDSIVYDDFSQTRTVYTFTLRESVVEEFEDAEGRTAYRIERSRKKSDTATFSVIGSYAITMTGMRTERLDDNLRTVPLIFPPREAETWDGNAFNGRGEQDYTYDYVDQAATLGALSFDSTLRVINLNDTDNFVIKHYAEERYARNVGLIYREFFDIETQFEVDSGLHWIQTVSDYSGR